MRPIARCLLSQMVIVYSYLIEADESLNLSDLIFLEPILKPSNSLLSESSSLCTYEHFSFSALGMCKRCGNLRMIACKKCKGAGLIREGSPFGLTLLDDSKLRSSSCTNCQGRGHFSCPECSKSSVWWSSDHVKSFFFCYLFLIWDISSSSI